MRWTRRSLIAAALIATAGRGLGKPAPAYEVLTEDGEPVANFRVAPGQSPANLPGVVRVGPPGADLVLYEVFDYACPYCRAASQDLDVLLTPSAGFRLGLVHHPVLSPRSADAARVVLAAARQAGDAAAYRLHIGLIEAPGRAGEEKALALAVAQGLDAPALKREAQGAGVAADLAAQTGLVQALALPLPSFVLGDLAVAGWPGANAVDSLVADMRRCGGLRCPSL